MGKEKKEIGKLLELLNEYSKNIGYFNEEDLQGQTKAWILSKEFGWIGWLVENDKIDFSKVKEKIGLDRELYDRMLYWYKEDDFLIMILSVENEPIRFLCEILK